MDFTVEQATIGIDDLAARSAAQVCDRVANVRWRAQQAPQRQPKILAIRGQRPAFGHNLFDIAIIASEAQRIARQGVLHRGPFPWIVMAVAANHEDENLGERLHPWIGKGETLLPERSEISVWFHYLPSAKIDQLLDAVDPELPIGTGLMAVSA